MRYNQLALSGIDITKGKFPIVSLGSCLEIVQYGTSEKANTESRGTPVLRINNIKHKTIDVSDLKHIEISPKIKKSLLLIDGDILIIRTNGSRDLVGACAVFHAIGEYIFASYLIRLRVDPAIANPDYLVWFLGSSLGRMQIDATSRQIMQNNINSEEIRGLQIPVPPLQIQHDIVARMADGRTEIARIKSESEAQEKTAITHIEAMIIGNIRVAE